MEKGKDLPNVYLAGLKNGCSSVCLWSLSGWVSFEARQKIQPTEGLKEKLYCYNSG